MNYRNVRKRKKKSIKARRKLCKSKRTRTHTRTPTPAHTAPTQTPTCIKEHAYTRLRPSDAAVPRTAERRGIYASTRYCDLAPRETEGLISYLTGAGGVEGGSWEEGE